MKNLQRFLSSWANLLTLAIAIGLFLISPLVLRWYDPTAGVFDSGFLQAIVLAAVFTFSEGFFGWVLWQLIFASLDRITMDTKSNWGNLDKWTKECTSFQKVMLVQGTFIFCLCLFSFNLWLALSK
ncbi:MAG: hypothetical protein D4R57_01530 [Verrucomicrobiales bacterium]|nr:MAG: hypothetical protein D4R57_01530 [Verrucomicrobiales bacterium]